MPVLIASSKTDFWFLPHDEQIADRYLEAHGISRPMIALHCGGRHFYRKRWPVERFARLAKSLRNYYECEVVCIGGTEDRETAFAIQSIVPEVKMAAGELSLAQTAALVSKCRLMIGNDSGPLHLSAALDTPTIGLFGPTHLGQFYPYNPELHRFIYKPFSCSPCYCYGGSLFQHVPRCSRAYCMEAITEQDILQEVELLFSQKNPISAYSSILSSLEPANRS
jgi:ADP-heptose:LPS heptosyltransferase